MIKKHLSSILLGTALLIISIVSLFIGVMDIDLKALLSSGNGMELNIFLLSRIPRLLAILCTGVGMSVAGLMGTASQLNMIANELGGQQPE